MIDTETMKMLQAKMLERRSAILAFRGSLQSSRSALQGRETELQEMANKDTLAEGVHRIDERAYAELKQIDKALTAISSGSYGRCEICEKPISPKRLQAIPWTPMCKKCAQKLEAKTEEVPEGEAPPSENMSDARVVETIWDEFDARHDMDTDKLEVFCNGGTILLAGSLPTEREHQIVLETIQEDLGFEDVIDRINIEELDKQRYGAEETDQETFEKETAMQGEPSRDDPYGSLEDDEPTVPPERMVTEDERGT
ncbi:TraR/DksA family transcriptional regulator [Desulfatitalea alkaliphila]|uniref:TraR/DksA C4-type zinc finger protein n=1 Tax=Desulfatitalea alkaliphila TaxID=2929485 RepID=A0AA41QZ51_9BACT|nr:TraR/DksA C4-type zinc finger protein [Desulfatitalea alkaliphila]MCJ8499024.1 TraR/DksA C4-type zinc finger protein [Desulfatitalea alkaliphila]